MLNGIDTSADQYWVHVETGRDMHPYSMHKEGNRSTVEVVARAPQGDESVVRRVIIQNGRHEAWVVRSALETYGYPITDDERVSDSELEAITLKHDALRDGASVTVTEAREFLEDADPDAFGHALIALYYAAKADQTIPSEELEELRALTREKTGHVDTSHKPTLMGIIEGADSLAE